MSTTLAPKTPATSSSWPRSAGSALTLISASSRSTAVPSCSSTTLSTRTSLSSWTLTCSTGVDAPSTTMVMRLTRSSWVGPTASDEMLKARRENSPATCDSTPGLFSTSTDRVCVLMRSPLHFPARGRALLVLRELRSQHDVVVRLAGRHHREDTLAVVGTEVHDHRHVGRGQRLVQHRVDFLGALASQPDAAVGLGELDVV